MPYPSLWTRYTLVYALVGVLITCLFVGCSEIGNIFSASPTAESRTLTRQHGTLRFAHEVGWGGDESLDPISPSPFDDAIMLLYSRLVRRTRDGTIEGEVATHWQPNADATVWHFTLRPGILFHNGRPLTARDVVFSFERIFDPQFDSPLVAVFHMIERVEAVDEQRVAFHLAFTTVDFPLLLTDRRMRILPVGVGAEVAMGIGSGPFQLEHFDARGVTTLYAFDDYWEGRPGLVDIEIVALPDGVSRAQALLAGELDYVHGLSAEQSARFHGRDEFELQTIPSGDWQGIVFQTDVEPFTDPRVRKALRLVADRQAMIDLALGEEGGTVACDTPIWEGDPYYTPLNCAQDIAEAQRLLAAAGYSDGITLTLTTSALGSGWLTMAELYQFQAAQAGIHVILNQVSTDGYWRNVWLVEPVVMTSWLERPASQVLAEAYRSDARWNESHWQNAEFDRLLNAATSALDVAERREIYATIQQMLWEEGGTLIPYHLNQLRVLNRRVTGIPAINQFEIRWHQVTKQDYNSS